MGALDFGPFLRLSEQERARLEAAGEERKVPAGEYLIREKSASSGCYVLMTGQLRVVRGESGEQLNTLRPPALVGEIGPVMSKPRNASVIADEASSVFFIPVIALREAMADEPKFAEELRAEIATRLTALG